MKTSNFKPDIQVSVFQKLIIFVSDQQPKKKLIFYLNLYVNTSNEANLYLTKHSQIKLALSLAQLSPSMFHFLFKF